MNITVNTIPHNHQRYDTVGDWMYDGTETELEVLVSDLKDWRYIALVGVHEQIEALLCKERGISQKDVDKFDLAFEGEGEPGDDPGAPYFHEHQVATLVERLLAYELGVNWQEYEKAINAL